MQYNSTPALKCGPACYILYMFFHAEEQNNTLMHTVSFSVN